MLLGITLTCSHSWGFNAFALGVIAVGLLFATPPLLLSKTDFLPVGIWSVSWIGAYFIGNIPSPKKKFVFALWFILTSAAMIWFMPE